ncbi:MAG: hypothetical protein R6W31_01045 [Bacteroidales bacterium]
MRIVDILAGAWFLGLIILGPACSGEPEMELPEGMAFRLMLKEPGNPPQTIDLRPAKSREGFVLKGDQELPATLTLKVTKGEPETYRIHLSIKALEEVNLNLAGSIRAEGISEESAFYLLPGFWYRNNLRSPEGAPSIRYGKQWMVREDRLSIPLTGVYDNLSGNSVTLCRTDEILRDALMPYKKGEVILYDRTDVGGVGFHARQGEVRLTFCYPFSEIPVTYLRKLTPEKATIAFQHFKAGEGQELSWEVKTAHKEHYSAFVEGTWNHAYDLFKPVPLATRRSSSETKELLTRFYSQSFTGDFELKGFSGVHLLIDSCEKRGLLEVGFVGRVLLNAYNALEYGYEKENVEMLEMAHQVFESYEEHGFTENGFIREVVDFRNHYETEIYSIRRQSEGLYAILQFLELEKAHNRDHPVMTKRAEQLLDKIVTLQHDGSFPRKFNDHMEILDDAGGSTSTAVIPLLMGWRVFGDDRYLESARLAARYIEDEIISKGDYFSSTLDADCEDKEASIYASCSMFYLGLVSEGVERAHYFALSEKAAYFALSWYYLWDVPFAPGQMLGDLAFKTTGWGNVSVENNHVDVYIFDFADVLSHLSVTGGNPRLAEMSSVIRSYMTDQLMPVEGRMCGIARVGYHPEVVQHTNWDYGQFGKGYYNDLFAPGWVVASLWELLSEDRLYNFLNGDH